MSTVLSRHSFRIPRSLFLTCSRFTFPVILLVGCLDMQAGQLTAPIDCDDRVRVVAVVPTGAQLEHDVFRASCSVLEAIAAKKARNIIPKPLIVEIVDAIDGQRMNARYATPALLDSKPGHVQITRDLVTRSAADELSFVMAHELAHRLTLDGWRIRALLGLRNVLMIAFGIAPAMILFRHRRPLDVTLEPSLRSPPVRTGTMVRAVAGGTLFASVSWLLATATISAVSTRMELAADARGLTTMVGGGWTPERATAAFHSFLAHNGDQVAGSWLSVDRHPSDAERATSEAAARAIRPPK